MNTKTLTTARHFLLLLLLVAERGIGYVVRVCRKSDTKNVPVLYRGGRYNEPLTTRYNQSDGFSFFCHFQRRGGRGGGGGKQTPQPPKVDLSAVGGWGWFGEKKGGGEYTESLGSRLHLLHTQSRYHSHKKISSRVFL